jgi:hypothetical protein
MKRYLFLIVSLISSIVLVSLTSVEANAQSRDRSYIREQISHYGECRNVAITKRNGDLMLYGRNGWAATGCPKGLTQALDELNEENEYIDDVQLTENGSWLILYGNNGLRWNDIPYSLEKKLREWNSKQEVITSVSFNDAGNWIAVSTNYVSASDANVQEWIAEGMEKYGAVWATCVTEDAVVVVYEEGFRTIGEVPNSLREKMKSTSINIYRLKIAGTAWFFSDGKSEYDYHM